LRDSLVTFLRGGEDVLLYRILLYQDVHIALVIPCKISEWERTYQLPCSLRISCWRPNTECNYLLSWQLPHDPRLANTCCLLLRGDAKSCPPHLGFNSQPSSAYRSRLTVLTQRPWS
jgi:hypothetical protein